MLGRHKATALANFKYKLETIIVLRLVLWLKLLKARRKRAERNKAALEIHFISHFSIFRHWKSSSQHSAASMQF
jgi:hypothetical protein